jgi:hypothetical protein
MSLSQENIQEKIQEKQKIEVDEQFLQNIKGIIDIVTTRIHWKSEELLPVGIVLKQIDELLEKK